MSHGKDPLYNQGGIASAADYKATLKNLLANRAYARREKKHRFFPGH